MWFDKKLVGYPWATVWLFTSLCLQADPLEVNIAAYNLCGFPEIHVFVQVSDSAGNPVMGLNEGNFEVYENDALTAFDLMPAYFGGTSFGLALDCSGSMSGYENQVINACTTFVSSMHPLDQASIVFFQSLFYTQVIQPMTNDHIALNNAILNYYTSGSTALWYGYTLALNECQDEIPPRVIIGFTDGQDNASGSYTQQTVTSFAEAVGAPVYSIGFGSVYAAPLIQVADATGGSYVYTTPDSLGYYYQQIQVKYQNQYEIAYFSPDPIPNGTP